MSRAVGVAAFGVVLTAAAATFGSLSLYVPGVALATLGVFNLAWVALARHGAAIERRVVHAQVEEGEPLAVELHLRVGLVPAALGASVDGPPLERPLRVRRSTPRTIAADVRFARRGRHALDPARLELRDPLGIAGAELSSQADEVLVLPRIEPIVAGAGGALAAVERDAARRGGDDAALELDTLRPYRPGAPAARIHWPTAARAGTLMERRLTTDSDALPLIVLDARGAPSDDALDRAVRAVTSLAYHLARRGGCAVALPGDRRPAVLAPDLRGWPPLHARLALVVASERAPLPARAVRGGTIVWVVASAACPSGLAHARAAGRYLVAPERLSVGRVAFHVAGCWAHLLERRRTAA